MKVRSGTRSRIVAVSAAVATALWLTVGVAGPAFANGQGPPIAGALYVSPHGSPGQAGTNCGTAVYTHIADAVSAALSGGTVVVCPGVYSEDVVVHQPLTLVGRNATIDATGLENALQVVSSDVTVSGFHLINANGEGLLVGVDSLADAGLLPPTSPVLTDVTVDHVSALNNDQGFNGTETGNCKYPGDCGGGIHFNGVEHSSISDSQASGNADGILLTDDYAPTAYNLIQGNLVSDNRTECGIVLPSHNPNAVNYVTNADSSLTVTGTNPTVGGVYDNQVLDNVTVDNGTATAPPMFGGVGGSGGGVGIFGAGPGTGAYDNLVQGNRIAGNGLAGVTIHAHHPGGEKVDGNVIVDNVFGTNNVAGDVFDGGVSNFATTAIAVYSVPPVTMTIADNVIRNNSIGVWLTDTVTANGLSTNRLHHVTTAVTVEPAN